MGPKIIHRGLGFQARPSSYTYPIWLRQGHCYFSTNSLQTFSGSLRYNIRLLGYSVKIIQRLLDDYIDYIPAVLVHFCVRKVGGKLGSTNILGVIAGPLQTPVGLLYDCKPHKKLSSDFG